jgi:hypothetical protein
MTKEKEKVEKSSLADFEWEEDDNDFSPPEPKKKEVKKPETKDEKEPKKEEEEKEELEKKEAEKFFEKDDDPPEETDEKFFTTLASELKEQGVFQNLKLEKDKTLSQEDFIKLQDEEVNLRVEEAIESFMEELDDDGKSFLKFKKDGGETRDFFSITRQKVSIPKGNLEDEKFQKKIIDYYNKNYEGMDDEESSDMIEWLQDGGKLEKKAEVINNKINSLVSKAEKEALKRQKELKESQELADKKFISDLTAVVKETDKIKDFPITKKDKSELVRYMTKPSVKVGKNKFLTQFQADLQKVTKDNKTFVLLAKLVKNGFDISDIKKTVETKKAVDLKSKLEKQKANPSFRSSGSSTKKQLSDYF